MSTNEALAETPTEEVVTFPCPFCNRTFVQESLEKHRVACEKMSTSQTNVFDSSLQRVNNTDITLEHVKKVKEELDKHGITRPKTAWREKHSELISTLQEQKTKRRSSCEGGAMPEPEIFVAPMSARRAK